LIIKSISIILVKQYKYLYIPITLLLLILIMAGCATYYKKTLRFQEYIYQGDFNKANNWLENDSKDKKGKNQLLYFLNRGYVSFMLKEHDKSNMYFQQADYKIEDFIKQPANEALALISNPMVKPYQPEDFEAVMLHYFSALNFLMQEKYEEALVECRRINIKLNKLKDRYKDHKNRYQRDAFANLLMGLIYDAMKDYNNAFIAYRNAYDVYKDDYTKNFNLEAPEQLKQDLLRTAYLTGFDDQVVFYEKEFGLKYQHRTSPNPELIFFWMNGFGPVKHEWSINFTNTGYNNGFITLVNEDLALNFPFYIGNMNANEQNAFGQLRFLRVAFPKY
jgi:uncharacterized protein